MISQTLGAKTSLAIGCFLALLTYRLLPVDLSPAGIAGGTFFNGQLWRILQDVPGAPMEHWINTIPNGGMIRFTIALNSERLLLTTPAALSEVLVKNSDTWQKPKTLRQSLARILGDSLVVAEGSSHRAQRKKLMPAFSQPHIKTLYPIFWRKACEATETICADMSRGSKDTLRAAADDDSVEVPFSDWLRRITLDNIGEAGFGYHFDAMSDPNSEVNRTYEALFRTSETGTILTILETLENIVPVSWLQQLPLKHNRQTDAAIRYIRDIIRRVIDDKIGSNTSEQDRFGVDVLSVALGSGLFTREGLVDQTMTFLAAGHETVSTAMSWALVALCQHPDMQRRLRDEVRAGLPSPSDRAVVVTDQHLQNLPFLQAFCSEVLRFHPPVPITRREAIKDTVILGQPIPKGTNVLLVPAAVNKSQSLWGDDALVFDPNRWLTGSQSSTGGASSNYANLTFLHGPRSCIGATFARAEFACLVAVLVGRLDMSFAEPGWSLETFKGGITHRLRDELRLKTRIVGAW